MFAVEVIVTQCGSNPKIEHSYMVSSLEEAKNLADNNTWSNPTGECSVARVVSYDNLGNKWVLFE